MPRRVFFFDTLALAEPGERFAGLHSHGPLPAQGRRWCCIGQRQAGLRISSGATDPGRSAVPAIPGEAFDKPRVRSYIPRQCPTLSTSVRRRSLWQARSLIACWRANTGRRRLAR
ncbi:hypothetical protein SPHINGO8AM_210064 [Sphingomonas sp. 8AM]|nr:hypothetical protein SPHINGO8AM_210064 [Sphingomonas sp. 8AM]